MNKLSLYKKICFFLIFSILISSCAGLYKKSKKQEVTIMTYNVETLFDNIKEPGKNDDTYLPIEQKQTVEHKKKCQMARFPKWIDQCLNWDWSNKVVEVKLQRIAEAIQQVNKGAGPDILLLQEVENKAILERLNKEHQLGFREIVLIEGRDSRGIDVAIMSKLDLVGVPSLHYVPFEKFSRDQREDSRGILEATFRLFDSSLLTVFSVHFPAPFHPVEMRKESLEFLNDLLTKLPKDRLVIAGGDFNIPIEEDEKTQILSEYVEPLWRIAHKEGCESCKGTTYYTKNNTWSFLDMILISRSIDSHQVWSFDSSQVQVANFRPQQRDKDGRPADFDPVARTGTSDHWPLVIKLIRVQ